MILLLTSVLCCTLLPFARSSEDEVVSSVHLEDTRRTLTEADLRTELHLPRDSKLLPSLSHFIVLGTINTRVALYMIASSQLGHLTFKSVSSCLQYMVNH